jgi:CcmD family protein
MLKMTRRIAFVILLAAVSCVSVAPLAAQTAQPQPQAQTEFVPVDQLPPQEQMPAAPLVIAAYAVAWLGMFVYLVSIWRRLQKVDRELNDVARRVTERSRT